MANALPRFYNVALNLEGLVFFATPHRSTSRLAWEEVLLDMIRKSRKGYRGRLSETLSGLVSSVSRLSYVFYRFASKYPIANFISAGQSDQLGSAMTFKNADLESIVSWTDDDGGSQDVTCCSADDLEKLEALRRHFAPQHLLLKLRKTNPRAPPSDTYFRILQALSPCRRFLHEPRALDRPDEFNELDQVYQRLLRRLRFRDIRGGSIQVTGHSGCGRSGLVKVISQRLRQDSSVVVVENFSSYHLQRHPESLGLYDVLGSVLHQILSQRPSIFHRVENLAARIVRQRVWPERAIQSLLSSVLLHAENTHLLVLVYDLESWPPSVRSWWPKMQHWLPASSSCTFVTSSHALDNDLTPGKTVHFNLGNNYDRYKRHLIKSRLRRHQEYSQGSAFGGEALSEAVQEDIIAAARSFQGSFTSISGYLSRLFESFTLRAPRAMSIAISTSSKSEQVFYRRELAPFMRAYSPELFWAIPTLSWVLLAARPLHVQELAAAAAIDLSSNTKQDMRDNISVDMERDLRTVLGNALSIENRRVRLISRAVKEVLLEDDLTGLFQQLDTDYRLTLHCLHYLGIVLADDSPRERERCMSYVSYRQQTRDPPDPVLEFLHYASLFWPFHFLRVEGPDEDLIAKIAEFLQRPTVAERWFELHLLCTATPHATEASTGDGKVEDGSSAEAGTRKRAAQMAGYVGLAPVVSYLSGRSADRVLDPLPVRHGHAQHNVVQETASRGYCLESAIANDDHDRVMKLLEADRGAMTMQFPLHRAASAGSMETVRALFHSMQDPTQRNDDGQTPLHLAAAGGHVDAVEYLLQQDAIRLRNRMTRDEGDSPSMLDAVDVNGQTPLVLAILMGQVRAAECLVGSSSVAGLTVRDRDGKTALHYAVVYCPQVVEAIVDKAATSPLVQDEGGRTPLHVAAQVNGPISASMMAEAPSSHVDLTKLLGMLDSSGRTALHCAAESGAAEVTRILAQRLSDDDLRLAAAVRDNHGNVPAELAAHCGHLDVMKLMASWTPERPGDHLLLAAAGAGQLLVVQYLLDNGCSPNGAGPESRRPLSRAASEGHEAVVVTLLQNGAGVNLPDSERRTALHHASAKGRCNVVRAFLAWDAPSGEQAHINTPDSLGYTPLHLAAMEGRIEAMALLLEGGADIEARSRERQTPLHLAVECAQAVELLLAKGAATESRDALNQTPLNLAVRNAHLESARALISGGADLNAEDDGQMTPLFYAIGQNNLAMVELFFETDPDAFRSNMWDNLKRAIQGSAVDVARFVIKRPPDAISMTDDQVLRLDELLSVTAKQDVPDILLALVALGADVKHHWGPRNRTPLHVAAANGRVENMRGLIELGAEVDATDANGGTPLHDAARSDEAEAVSLLLGNGASINAVQMDQMTPLFIAAYNGRVEAAKALLKGGADVALCRRVDGWSPLHAAADSLAVASLLIEHGANVNLQNGRGWTPLHLASAWDHTSIVQLMLEHGGDPNLASKEGTTPFHIALQVNAYGPVRAMLDHRGSNTPDLDSPSQVGLTPIQVAARKGHEASKLLTRMLVEKGANVQARTGGGETCLSMAAARGLDGTLEILLSAPGKEWDYRDLVTAYWQGIRAGPSSRSTRCVELLLDKEGRLLLEMSDQDDSKSNGLEAYFLEHRPDDDHSDTMLLPILLVSRGIDPFQRHLPERTSTFELGIVAGGRRNDEYIDACAKYIPRQVQLHESASFGLRELRIATELDTTTLWKKLEPLLMKHVETEMDQDGWTIQHFLSQSAPRLEFAPHNNKNAPITGDVKTPTAMVWPLAWQVNDPDMGAGVEISPDRREASFEGTKLVPEYTILN